MKNKHLVMLFFLCVCSVFAYRKFKSDANPTKSAAHYRLEVNQITNMTIKAAGAVGQEFSIHPSDNGWLASSGTKHLSIPKDRLQTIMSALTSLHPVLDTEKVPDSLLRQVNEIAILTPKSEKLLFVGKPILRNGTYLTPVHLQDKSEPLSIDFHWMDGTVGNLYSLDFQQFRNTHLLPNPLPVLSGLSYTFADFAPLYLSLKDGSWMRPGQEKPSQGLHDYVQDMLQSVQKLTVLQPSDDFDPAVEKETFFAELQLENAGKPINLLCFRRNYGKSVYFLKSSLNDDEVFELPDNLANKIFVVPALGVE